MTILMINGKEKKNLQNTGENLATIIDLTKQNKQNEFGQREGSGTAGVGELNKTGSGPKDITKTIRDNQRQGGKCTIEDKQD